MNMARKNYTQNNKNAIVRTRFDRTGKLRTETALRDDGEFDVAISTDLRNNSTRVFIDSEGRDGNFLYPSLELNGRQARTLYRVLSRHFLAQSKHL
jgi:hypothetical protein